MTPWPGDPDVTLAVASSSAHIGELTGALDRMDVAQLSRWGRYLAGVLRQGRRLLAAGNGGSAAEAQHLTSELMGRFRDDREPFSAIALHAETSTVTAVANDYGYEEVFARQVRGHGRPGDALLLLSTSGRSRNVLRAAEAGRSAGLTVLALTGDAPNPLASMCADAVTISAASVAVVQECHLVAVHLICAAVDDALGAAAPTGPGPAGRAAPAPETVPASGTGLISGTGPTAAAQVVPATRPAGPAR